MRIARVLAAVLGVVVVVPAISAGCISAADNCERSARCEPPGAGATGMGAGGSDAGTSPMCIPSQADGPVDDNCGIFVSKSGNDMNTGTKGSPVATIGHAILEANGTNRPIYVCNEAFAEVVEAPAGIELYGGLDCASGWTWSEAGRTTLTAAPDSVPLKLTSGAAVTRVENFTVTAADAMQLGGSSVAAIIDNVTAEIARCELTARAGRDGMNGDESQSAAPGAPGVPGVIACSPVPVMGGPGGMTMCGDLVSLGGSGGNGGVPGMAINGQPGGNGQPDSGDPAKGKGGLGQDAVNLCESGANGANGISGAPGAGATELGMLSISGISGGTGPNGGDGTPGQGGGGGGGGKAGVCSGGTPGAGASGGGGGAGGCGGKGGAGGGSGGSSIALISLNSTLKLTQVTLTAGTGGIGGNGALGEGGGSGGTGGNGGSKVNAGSFEGCSGGKGGSGGDGGPGGGGRGGHSLGIAFRGTPPPAEGYTLTPGAPGNGGVGATMDPAGIGAMGMAVATPVEFP